VHAQGYVGRRRVRAGNYQDLTDAQIVIVTAGVGQRPGEERLSLLNRNAAVFRGIAKQLDRHAPGAILLIASNPVDVLTSAMQGLSARPHEAMTGTGTILDTTRLRSLLAEHYQVDPRSVRALILGEHGDSEIAVWRGANVGGTPVLHNTILGKPCDPALLESILTQVRRAAYEIIERKGYTNWAIGLVLAHLVRTIQEDQGSVLPIRVRLRGEYGIEGVCLSIPVTVGIHGAGGRVPSPWRTRSDRRWWTPRRPCNNAGARLPFKMGTGAMRKGDTLDQLGAARRKSQAVGPGGPCDDGRS
jgi:L-lactate dehydrogenase